MWQRFKRYRLDLKEEFCIFILDSLKYFHNGAVDNKLVLYRLSVMVLLNLKPLTHWDWDEMDNISQTTFWNVFSSMKMFEFRLKFHWSLFLRIQLTILHHWCRWWLGAVHGTSHYLNQWWLVYRCIYASFVPSLLKWYWLSFILPCGITLS